MPESSAIRSARRACHGSVTTTALCQPRSPKAADTARMLSRVSTPSGTASRAPAGTPAFARYSRPASASVNSSPAARPPTVTITGATPFSYRVIACSSRASKIEDGTPLYWAEPSTTIASETGRESCRAFHQMASPVEATSRTNARTAAPATRFNRFPMRTPTGHGYHAQLTRRAPWGQWCARPVSRAGASATQRRAGRLQPSHRHPERRAGHVVQPDLVEEVDRVRIPTVLAADAQLEFRAGRATGLGADLHESPDALPVQRLERRDPEDALVQVLVEECRL